jgi:hypothetical protein
MEHSDQAREMQMAIWRSWTPVQRLRALGRISSTVLALRDRCLRQAHADATEEEFRQLRIEATLASSPSRPLP